MTEEDESPPERDPFGRLEESAGDREGDPFEFLSDPDADEGAGSGGEGVDDGSRSDAGATAEDVEANAEDGVVDPPGSGVEPGTPEIDAGDPETRTDDPFSSPDSAFQRMDVGDVDEDDVWEAIADAEARGSVADVGERTYAEVSKHRFCETCEYFTGPPEIACTHDGTEILKFLDMETVRVVDCPIVEERRALKRGDDPNA